MPQYGRGRSNSMIVCVACKGMLCEDCRKEVEKVESSIPPIDWKKHLCSMLKEGPDMPPTDRSNCEYQPLFDHMHEEHGLILLESEMQEIIRVVDSLTGKDASINE
jgi:hypothetical protein